jgi:hypothetical protein
MYRSLYTQVESYKNHYFAPEVDCLLVFELFYKLPLSDAFQNKRHSVAGILYDFSFSFSNLLTSKMGVSYWRETVNKLK